MKKAWKVISSVLFGIVFAFLLYLIIAGVYFRVTGNYLVPYQMTWVLTDSMEPTIPARSYILVKRDGGKDAKIGDVVTFVSEDPKLQGAHNTHRIVGEENGRFVTKGDHYAVVDEYTVSRENIVATYVCTLYVMTFFGRIFSTKMGLFVFIAAVLIGLTVSFVIYLKKEKKKEIQRRIEEEVKRLEEEAKAKEAAESEAAETVAPEKEAESDEI